MTDDEARAATVWGDSCGVTWANATDAQREAFTLQRLYWFFRMVETGGPDGTDLDTLVYDEAREAAAWFGPVYEARAERAR